MAETTVIPALSVEGMICRYLCVSVRTAESVNVILARPLISCTSSRLNASAAASAAQSSADDGTPATPTSGRTRPVIEIEILNPFELAVRESPLAGPAVMVVEIAAPLCTSTWALELERSTATEVGTVLYTRGLIIQMLSVEAVKRATSLPLDVHLMITDVGLPGGINGQQLAEAVRTHRKDLKVLLITGYARNAGIGTGSGEGRLPPGMELLTKPFAMQVLANKVRQMLEA